MQSINRAAPNPLFIVALVGTGLGCVVLGIVAGTRWVRPAAPLGADRLGPLRRVGAPDRSPTTSPQRRPGRSTRRQPGAAERWQQYLAEWVPWNHVRTVTASPPPCSDDLGARGMTAAVTSRSLGPLHDSAGDDPHTAVHDLRRRARLSRPIPPTTPSGARRPRRSGCNCNTTSTARRPAAAHRRPGSRRHAGARRRQRCRRRGAPAGRPRRPDGRGGRRRDGPGDDRLRHGAGAGRGCPALRCGSSPPTCATCDLDEGPFDAIVGRWVLMYQPDPGRPAAPAGDPRPTRAAVIAFQESDLVAVAPDVPGRAAARPSWPGCCTAGRHRRRAADGPAPVRRVRRRRAAGADRADRHAGRRRSRLAGLRYVVATMRSLLPMLVAVGGADPDEVGLDTLADRLRDEVVARDGSSPWRRLRRLGPCGLTAGVTRRRSPSRRVRWRPSPLSRPRPPSCAAPRAGVRAAAGG